MNKFHGLIGLMLLAGAAHGRPESAPSAAPFTPDRSRAEVYLEDIHRVLGLAQRGELGRLRPGSVQRAKTAYAEIEALLDGHDSALELNAEDRALLFNRQEQIVEWLGLSNRSRMVCLYVTPLGTRLRKTECMTVAERAQRELRAKRDTREIQRYNCRPEQKLVVPC